MQSQDRSEELFAIRAKTLKSLRKSMGEFAKNRWMKAPIKELVEFQGLKAHERIIALTGKLSDLPEIQRIYKELAGVVLNTIIFDFLFLTIRYEDASNLFQAMDVFDPIPFTVEEMHSNLINAPALTGFVEKLAEYYVRNFHNDERIHPFWFLRAISDYFQIFLEKHKDSAAQKPSIIQKIEQMVIVIEAFLFAYIQYDTEITGKPSEQ